jgi:hypothetical protein
MRLQPLALAVAVSLGAGSSTTSRPEPREQVLPATATGHAAPSAVPIVSAPGSIEPPPTPPAFETDIPLPADIACRLYTDDWAFGTHTLHLRRGGPAFARIDGGPAALILPVGPASAAVFEGGAAGVRIRGIVPSESLRLSPAAPFAFASVAAVKPNAVLRWVGGATDRIHVELRHIPSEIVGHSKDAFRTERPCGDVALVEAEFDPLGTLFGPDKKRRGGRLRPGAIPLAPSQSDRPVASLVIAPIPTSPY